MVDYAHDEGAEYTGFGRALFFWISQNANSALGVLDALWGGTTAQQWRILAICVLQGIDAGLVIQTALYKGDLAEKQKNKRSFPFVGSFMALAINIGLKSSLARSLAIPGTILIILGQKTVFGDR